MDISRCSQDIRFTWLENCMWLQGLSFKVPNIVNVEKFPSHEMLSSYRTDHQARCYQLTILLAQIQSGGTDK